MTLLRPATLCRNLLLSAALAALAYAADAPATAQADGPIVELPKYVVTDSRELPPPEQWRYASIPGFEILSNASDSATKRLVDDFQMFHQALITAWPVERISSVPTSLIICAKKNKFDEFKPAERRTDVATVSLFLKDEEQTAIVLDYEAKVIEINSTESVAGITMPDGSTVSSSGFRVDINRQLYREYVRYLLSRVNPPAWFEEGLSQIFMKMDFDKKQITVGKIEDPNTVSIEQSVAAQQNADAAANGDTGSATAPQEDRDFNAALARARLMPMQEMFDVARDSETARANVGSLWAKQCQAFVHLCIYGENGKYQKSFLQFVDRTAKQPPTEPLFKECFNMSYRDMLMTIRGYTQYTNARSWQVHDKKGQAILDDPVPLNLRDATEAEVGRIKGDALRIGGHLKESHANLIAPYVRGERDPQLLGALGLEEFAANETARATKFLEAAATAKVQRPRVYLALAQLRYNAALTAPRADHERFDPQQTVSVLTPLFTARSQPPALPDVYKLVAATWSKSSIAPSRENIGVLFEGVRMFPRESELVYDTAQLCVRAGLIAEAGQLADLGAKVSADDVTRVKFTTLKTGLPPVTAPKTPAPAAPTPTKSG